MIFYGFMTWMVFKRLSNCNDYKLENKLTTNLPWLDAAETKTKALQSLALAGLLTLLALL